jgi:hypothetical protein
MLYRLKFSAVHLTEKDEVFEGESEIALKFDVGNNFAANNAIVNSLVALVPILFGDVISKIEGAMLIDENLKEGGDIEVR